MEIEILLGKGYSFRDIAQALERSPNTISYEIRVNGGKTGYRAANAHIYARTRMKDKRWQWSKIEADPYLRSYIVAGLRSHWNPDEIAGAMRQERKPFYASKTAIYEWLRSIHGQRYCPLLYSKRYRKKKRRGVSSKRTLIPNRTGIEFRPRGAQNRSRYGHWEGDTMVSAKNTASKAALSVICERRSRYVEARTIDNLKPASHASAVSTMMQNKKALSLTQDNGIENTDHEQLGMPTFFCDPYSSWQKGGVENANKMIRRYIPKGTDLSSIPQEYLDQIVSIINQKPRKILGYRSALEVARAAGVVYDD